MADKPNAVYLQTRAVELSENDPDYPALALAVRLFGAGSGSRISRRLREQDSLTYGAYAYLSADREVPSGAISVRAIHAPANLDRLEQALDQEITKARADGFTETELDALRQSWAQQRTQVLADEGNVASVLASNLYWGESMKRWQKLDESIRTTSLDAVNAAFRKYMSPDQVLVIGAGEYGRKVVEAEDRPVPQPASQ